jgi:hypothetical protein
MQDEINSNKVFNQSIIINDIHSSSGGGDSESVDAESKLN